MTDDNDEKLRICVHGECEEEKSQAAQNKQNPGLNVASVLYFTLFRIAFR